MPTRILFVCMGNICRSPTAEAVFNKIVAEQGLGGHVEVDSAGTTSFHVGESADRRMKKAASRRGYDLTSLARRVTHEDFSQFDYILACDRDNYFHLLSLAESKEEEARVKLLTDYHSDASVKEVPDPYYGGAEGFEDVLDIVEFSCQNLLEEIREKVS